MTPTELNDALANAVAEADVPDVERLLADGASPHHQDTAWKRGMVELAVLGAGFGERDNDRRRPVERAALVRLLVARGAPLEATSTIDPRRSSVLHSAARLDLPEAAQALIDAGADVNAQDANGCSVLDVVTPWEKNRDWFRTSMVRLLLEAGADPHRPSGRGPTPAQILTDWSAEAARLIAEYDARQLTKSLKEPGTGAKRTPSATRL